MNSPDILFIVLDTQRADRLGCYGYDKDISPNLDRFSAESILFEQAISPAQWTIPSHASFFTGLYPTNHQVTQSSHRLDQSRQTLAELLQGLGYQTVGFCNNPLVGILDNGFKRGFQLFYNYGGAIPSLPKASSNLPWPIGRLIESYTQFLRKISYPIQNFFGQSDLAFRLSLNAWITPLWSKLANFKGQNARSVNDITHFLQERENSDHEEPLFLFLNLMETHLPFSPPGKYVNQVAPYILESKEARSIMQTWNREAYRWAAPLAEPLGDLESQVLSDMYDAEVAYQDDYLGQLFEFLEHRRNRENTLTIIVADHGDGLGEHGYMGHAFVAYQELVHVPLILHWPAAWPQQERIERPISTRRVFHTVLDAAGYGAENSDGLSSSEIQKLSLKGTIESPDLRDESPIAEIYPPMNFVKAIEQRQPHLLHTFGCLSERKALVGQRNGSIYKLIHGDGETDELFDLIEDSCEENNLSSQAPDITAALDEELKRRSSELYQQIKLNSQTTGDEVQMDGQLIRRLRGLGYLD